MTLDLQKEHDVAQFVDLFRRYKQEISPSEDPAILEAFTASVLRRLQENDRWIALLRTTDGDAVGFSSFKIDKDERVGWGYILEFYVLPAHRGQGVGRYLVRLSCEMLVASGVSDVWLTADPEAELFWSKCGFRATTEFGSNKQRVFVMAP